MEETLDFINNLLQQAYFYIPAILGFISAIGFPSLVQIAKIVASVKLYITKIAVVFSKVNETVEATNKLADLVLSYMDDDAKFFEDLAATEYNKKRRQAYLDRAETIRRRKQESIKHIDLLKEEVEKAKKKVRVKVKVKGRPQEAVNEKGAE